MRDRPLDLGQANDVALYEPLHEPSRDPVTRLYDGIDLGGPESLQLVAGFRGTGKSTEFSRLHTRLAREGSRVVRIDLDEWLAMHTPIEPGEFLLVLAGSIADAMGAPELLGPQAGVGLWDRVVDLIGQVRVSDVAMKTTVGELKIGLREGTPGVRERVRKALAAQMPSLVELVRGAHRDHLVALRQRHGPGTRLVVIVDSLEHVHGTKANYRQVQESVEDLFATHLRHVMLPDTHLVLSVPPFLSSRTNMLEADLGQGAVQKAWPAQRVRHRDGRVDQAAVDAMARLVERRFDWRQVLPDRAALDTLILASGGSLRDLLNMLHEAVRQLGLVPPERMAQRVVSQASQAYLPVYAEERAVLASVAAAKDLVEVPLAQAPLVARMLDQQLLLCYLDEGYWFDIHPLVASTLDAH